MDLPGRQAELIERVSAANPNTVIVVNAGSPITTRCTAGCRARSRATAPIRMSTPLYDCSSEPTDTIVGNDVRRIPTARGTGTNASSLSSTLE